MSELHLSEPQLRAYQSRHLSGAKLLACDDHLTSCAACCERLRDANAEVADAVAAAAVPMSLMLRHLDDATIERLASGTLDASEIDAVESHIESCDDCRTRWHVLHGVERGPGWWHTEHRGALGAAIAATLLLVFGAIYWSRPTVARIEVPVTVTAQVTDVPSQHPRVPDAIVLHDAQGDVTVTGSSVTGIAAGVWQEEVTSALLQRRLVVPEMNLATSAIVLRGPEAERSAIVLQSPVATPVETRQPRFRWKVARGVASSRISIYTIDTRRVAQSEWSAATSWQSPVPLARGETYVWQVSTRTASDAVDELVSAPARFRVLSGDASRELAAARATQSHLILGTVAAAHGLVDVAAIEFRELRDRNPDSPLAATLYAQALAAQRGSPTTMKEAQKNG